MGPCSFIIVSCSIILLSDEDVEQDATEKADAVQPSCRKNCISWCCSYRVLVCVAYFSFIQIKERALTRCAMCNTTPRGRGAPVGSGRGEYARGAIDNCAPHRSPI